MKLLLAFMLFLAVSARAQVNDVYSDTTRESTTWHKIWKGPFTKINVLSAVNDTSSGSRPFLVIAFEADTTDTTGTRYYYLKGQETLNMTGLGIAYIYVKSSAATIPERIFFH